MSNICSYETVLSAILAEIEHQNNKYGKDKPQSLPGFMMIMRHELNEAELGWNKNLDGRNSALAEVTQVAAVAIQCLMRYGVIGSAISTDDIG